MAGSGSNKYGRSAQQVFAGNKFNRPAHTTMLVKELCEQLDTEQELHTHTDVNRQNNGCRLCVANHTQMTAWRGDWVLSVATGSSSRARAGSALGAGTTAAVSSTKSL